MSWPFRFNARRYSLIVALIFIFYNQNVKFILIFILINLPFSFYYSILCIHLMAAMSVYSIKIFLINYYIINILKISEALVILTTYIYLRLQFFLIHLCVQCFFIHLAKFLIYY